MNVSSPLFPDLSKAVDLGGGPAPPTLEVPAALLAVAQLPLQQTPTVIFNVLTPQRSSFFNYNAVVLTNGAILTQTLCTFGQGLWHIHLAMMFISNFDDFASDSEGGIVELGDPTGTFRPLWQGPPKVSPGIVAQNLSFRSLMVDDGWALRHSVFTNGVGQTGHQKTTVVAEKLL